jgi:REP element-mobilizing transposase RayT
LTLKKLSLEEAQLLQVRDICRQVCFGKRVDNVCCAQFSDQTYIFIALPQQRGIFNLVHKIKDRSSYKA